MGFINARLLPEDEVEEASSPRGLASLVPGGGGLSARELVAELAGGACQSDSAAAAKAAGNAVGLAASTKKFKEMLDEGATMEEAKAEAERAGEAARVAREKRILTEIKKSQDDAISRVADGSGSSGHRARSNNDFVDNEKEEEEAAEAKRAAADAAMMEVESLDLVRYGLIPEFVGRFPITVPLKSLGQDELVQVLMGPHNAVVGTRTTLFLPNV